MDVATDRCHRNPWSDSVPDVGRPPTGETFIARQRVERRKWDRFLVAAQEQGTDGSKAVNEFIDWYLRERGAKLPERPAVKPRPSGTAQ